MPRFSKRSLERLSTCHPDLQRLMHAVIERFDIAVLCGHRTREEQERAYRRGFSKARFGQSKHNAMPSLAVDVAPYPIDWNDLDRFHEMARIVKEEAARLGIQIRWGGDFNSFFDGPHFELV